MARTLEEVFDVRVNSRESLAAIQPHLDIHDLDRIDSIYVRSEYFPRLYRLKLNELVDYAHSLNISISFEPIPSNFFKILRTVIYYMDLEVQQALLEYDMSGIRCSDVSPPPSSTHSTQMEVISDEDEVIPEWMSTQPETSEPLEEPDMNQEDTIIDKQKWWTTDRTDMNVPFIPETDQPYKYEQTDKSTHPLDNDILDGLHSSDSARSIINNVDMEDIIARLGSVDYQFFHANTLLHLVAQYSDRDSQEKVRTLLAAGDRVNMFNNNGETPLMLATNRNQLEIMRELLIAGADMNFLNGDDETVLMTAIVRRNISAIKLLIEYGVDVDRQNKSGDTGLILASRLEYNEAIELLTADSPSSAVNIKNNDGHTALMMVTMYRNMEGIELLLSTLPDLGDPDLASEGEIDVNVQNEEGNTALMIATEHEYIDGMEILIVAGTDLNIQNEGGYTALMIATEQEYIEGMEMLIGGGADLDIQSIGGSTALMIATDQKSIEGMNVLIVAGADLNIQNEVGDTSLMLAAIWNNREGINVLLVAGADMNMQNNKGSTALMLAVYGNKIENVKWLIAWGANPDISNHNLNTPLIMAAKRGHTQIITILLEMNVHSLWGVNAENNRGNTFLYYIDYDDTGLRTGEFYHYLLRSNLLANQGIDVNHVNKDGQTALFTVSHHIANFLLDQGADINHVDHEGKNALFYINDTNKAIYLIEHGIDVHHRDHEGKTALETMKRRCLIKQLYNMGVPLPSYVLALVNSDEEFIKRMVLTAQGEPVGEKSRKLYEEISDKYSWILARWAVENSQIILDCCMDVKEYTKYYDQKINKIIRNYGEPWSREAYSVVKDIYRALEETAPLPEDTIVYRGINEYEDMLFDNIHIGDRLNMRGFLSFSLDERMANQFIDEDEGYMIKTIFPAGLKALLIDADFDTSYWREMEILTYPNLQFEVVSKYDRNGFDDHPMIEVKLTGIGEHHIRNL